MEQVVLWHQPSATNIALRRDIPKCIETSIKYVQRGIKMPQILVKAMDLLGIFS